MRSAEEPIFSIGDTHGVLTRPDVSNRMSSEGLGWRNVFASRQHENPYHESHAPRPDPLVVLGIGPPGPVEFCRRVNGIAHREIRVQRGVFVLPAGYDYDVELLDPLETMHIYVRQHVIDEALSELPDDVASATLLPNMAGHDPVLTGISQLCSKLIQERQSDYVAEGIARLLAGRLITHYSSNWKPDPSKGHTLSKAQLATVCDYIQENLDGNLTIERLAAVVQLNSTWFARTFRRTTGLPPHQYVLSARVARARHLLEGDTTIAEIAYECGFSNQEHLTRVFGRVVGLTPAIYRRSLS